MNWTRRRFVQSLSATAGALSVGAYAGASDRPPNIVLILMDDGSRDWLSCYGSRSVETPNIDALAQSGMGFRTFYATPLCTPTRVSLLTGKYPFRTGWTQHHDAPRWGGQYFDWNLETTFARLLRDAGYATCLAGKWQINDLRSHPDALNRHGFDEHCLWPGFETGNPPSTERYWDPYLVTNQKRQTHPGEFGPDIVDRYAVDFIRRNTDQPFLLYYPLILPHSPYVETPVAPSDSKDNKTLFRGMIQQVDHYVGNIIRALEETGARENTLVLFTGDNGSSVAGTLGNLEIPAAKGTWTDRGVHVPLIASWPKTIAPGVWTTDLADVTDIFPTLLNCAGIPAPGNDLDGQSFLPTLNQTEGPRREWIFSQLTDLKTRTPHRLIRDKQFLFHNDGRCFAIENDPLEKVDLSNSKEPEHMKAREKLQAVLTSLPDDTPLPGFPPGYDQAEPPKVG